MSRVADLVPIRHGRMMVSPFTFYRGAALLMAADLARTPSSGLIVQLCGDAHLSNFGLFASAERHLVFDINDFDETHPGPFEWDVKRLVASFEIAGRYRGFTDQERRANNLAAARGYRERMLQAAESGVLEAWYDHLDVDKVQAWLQSERDEEHAAKRQVKAIRRRRRQGAHEGQHAGVLEARLERERAAAHHRGPAADRARRRPLPRRHRRRGHRGRDARHPRRVPRRRCSHANHPLAEFTLRAHGAQGRRRGKRRHARVDRAAAWPRRRRSAVPPGEGGSGVGARAIPRAVRVREPGRARRARPAPHAGLERHLPRMAARPRRGRHRARLLHATAPRLEGIRRRREGRARAEPCSTPASAERRSRERTPARATASRSPRTWASPTAFDEAIADFAEAYADQNDADYAAFLAAIESGRLEARQGL